METNPHEVCFHHDDLDGHCSAAIVRSRCGARCVSVNYKDPFPFDEIYDANGIWIVDFSLGEDTTGGWEELFRVVDSTDAKINITWIDHHKTAIELAENNERVDKLAGLRGADTPAACELTWQYLYANRLTPHAVALIGDYDTFEFKYGSDTRDFHAGVEALYDTRPGNDSLWYEFLVEDEEWMWRKICDIGRDIRAQQVITDAERMKGYSYPVEFFTYKAVAINTHQRGSTQFESVIGDYELLLPYVHDGNVWTVGVYRGGKGEHIDCSELAELFGGGGHPGAAGFTCRSLPFGGKP